MQTKDPTYCKVDNIYAIENAIGENLWKMDTCPTNFPYKIGHMLYFILQNKHVTKERKKKM